MAKKEKGITRQVTKEEICVAFQYVKILISLINQCKLKQQWELLSTMLANIKIGISQQC